MWKTSRTHGAVNRGGGQIGIIWGLEMVILPTLNFAPDP